MDKSKIRNFSIIAHIDHGKSTLADRIIEYTGAVNQRDMKSQLLDNMDIERERGITIKLNTVALTYKADDGEEYYFHLIDTPGHVDFAYEVSRSLAACEGAILVVDASQGIQAQTIANVYLALDNNLEIVPVINKVDLPSARPDEIKQEIEDVLGIPSDDAPLVSAKTGLNIKDVMESIVKYVPSPTGKDENPLQALIFDSFYDAYRGAIVFIRVKEGCIKVGDKIKMMATNQEYEVLELGIRNPYEVKKDKLVAGEVGWIGASIKQVRDVRVGDTITSATNPCVEPLPGYREMEPMVYCGIYPIDNAKYNDLKDALEKLKLNDDSLVFEPETSQALGFGFRCGFLGLLHMDVTEERVEREYNIPLIATAPSVIYHVYLNDGSMVQIDNPSKLPDVTKINRIEEPIVRTSIMTPNEYVGALMDLCQKKRGVYKDLVYIDSNRMELVYELPLSEIVYDFFDKLKSSTKGYASFDYELCGYKASKLIKMDILINGETLDALSIIVHKDNAYHRGNYICEKLKTLIPRQQFEVPIQAAINGKIIARSTLKAMRKDVLAKCYGGDISRKKKLLEKQKEGKKRMKSVGSVEVPQEAFMSILSMDDE